MLSPVYPPAEQSPVAPRAGRVTPVAALVALLACAVYANSLGNGLVYDDVSVIATNEAVERPTALGTIFLTPSWFTRQNPTIAYRPFTTWTFALNYALHGLHPLGYHVVNVLLHAGVSALVVVLAAAWGLAWPVAGVAGALFAVHPVHTEVVANVVGRAEVLAAFFALLAFLAQRRAATGGAALPLSAGVVVAYALALLSKENTVALVALIPLADLVLEDDGSPATFARRLPGRRLALYVALLLVTAGYLWLRVHALGGIVGAPGPVPFSLNPAASAPAELRVLTALGVQALAVWRLVAPFHLAADYSWSELPVATSLVAPRVLAGLALALGLLALAVVTWRRSRVAFLWLALALLTWGVVSNLLVPIGTIFGERLLYLPSIGFCALVAMALVRPPAAPARAFVGAALALVVVWGVRTALRNPVWRSALTFAEATVRDAPNSGHARHVLGTVYSQHGRDGDALREFDRALRIDPDDLQSLYNAGVIYQRQNMSLEALSVFARVTNIDPRHFPAWINRASANNSRGSFSPALSAADRAVELQPEVPNGHVVRGFALRGLGRHDEARQAFERALTLAPTMPEALLGLGANAVDQTDFALAASAFERLVAVAPMADAYRGLVFSYREAGRTADAERVAEEARQRFPDDEFFRESAE